MKKLWYVFIIVLTGFFLTGCDINTQKVYDVNSSSMEPTIMAGARVTVKEVDPSSLSEGDIILFEDNIGGVNYLTIARISAINVDGNDHVTYTLVTDSHKSFPERITNQEDIIGKVTKIKNPA